MANKPRNLKAVIFDVDGTLVDSNDLHVEAWREAFGQYGIAPDREDIHAQMGKGGDQLMPVFCSQEQVEKFGADLEKLRIETFARDYLPQVRPFPKVRELFERLHSYGLQIALATSSKQSELEQYLKILNVQELVVATSADDADHSKPCPDIFEAALARLDKVFPEETIVVGDTPYDVIAAGRAGMGTIALLSGGFEEETLRDAGAVAVYLDIADLLEQYEAWLSASLKEDALTSAHDAAHRPPAAAPF